MNEDINLIIYILLVYVSIVRHASEKQRFQTDLLYDTRYLMALLLASPHGGKIRKTDLLIFLTSRVFAASRVVHKYVVVRCLCAPSFNQFRYISSKRETLSFR